MHEKVREAKLRMIVVLWRWWSLPVLEDDGEGHKQCADGSA
jgi:hypothetical protein